MKIAIDCGYGHVKTLTSAGGGAELLRGRLPEIYEIHPDPQFANVFGYLAAISA